jgi:hypothetical protein
LYESVFILFQKVSKLYKTLVLIVFPKSAPFSVSWDF